jgi:hypothetical protein
MSSPNLAGSLNLLVRYYETTHGDATPLSSTMKAVLIQTADEAGSADGPDYEFGWGLVNTLEAAHLIEADSLAPGQIAEDSLMNSGANTYYLYHDSSDAIRLTLVWTDPPGTSPPPSLNPSTPMLVNDLDLRLEHIPTSAIFHPYVMDPENPSNPVATGDNIRDNIEQIHIASPPAGYYEITVSHKSTLASQQYYSLVSSSDLLEEAYICGDCNGDGRITVADATYLVGFIYRQGPPPLGSGDANLDGRVTIADATYVVTFIYRGGPAPCEI